MSDDTPEDELAEWGHLSRTLTEESLAWALLVSWLRTSSKLDSFSGWAMIMCGGALSLLVANAESIGRVLDDWNLRAGIVLLLTSCLLGAIAKYLALNVDVILGMATELKPGVEKILDEHDAEVEPLESVAQQAGIIVTPRIEKVHEALLKSVWRPNRWLVRRSFRSDGNRPSETLQAGVSWIQWQGLFIVLQIVAVFVSFVVLVRGF